MIVPADPIHGVPRLKYNQTCFPFWSFKAQKFGMGYFGD